jgi:hypothetical protein
MAGKQKLAMAIKVLQDALPLYGASSDEGQIILKCLKDLGKMAQPGDIGQAATMNGLQQMMLKAAQQGKTQQGLAQPKPEGGPGGAAGGAPPPAAA